MAISSRFVAFASKFNPVSVRHLVPLQSWSHKRCFRTCFDDIYRSKSDRIFAKQFHLSSYIPRHDPTVSDSDTFLSSEVITTIISENENYADIGDKNITYIETNHLPANIPLEDMHAEGRLLTNDGYIFGVFDGHAGASCASFVSECLFTYLAICLASNECLNRLVSASCLDTERPFYEGFLEWISSLPNNIVHESNQFVTDSLHRFMNDRLEWDTSDVTERIKAAFVRLDNDITIAPLTDSLHPQLRGNLTQAAFSGSCATVAYVDHHDLYVANVGDSRAVIGTINESGKIEAKQVSRDHNFQNGDEILRLSEAHPNELSTVLVENRLLGTLAPLRAFGDVKFKWSLDDLKRIMQASSPDIPDIIPSNYRTPPYLTAEPEVFHHRLSANDKFLVLATDGLWDEVSPQRVVTLVHRHITQYEGASRDGVRIKTTEGDEKHSTKICDRNCATLLIRHALGYHDRHVSMHLSLPAEVARDYRDDITVTIIYFSED